MSAIETCPAAAAVLERGSAASVFSGAQAAWARGDRLGNACVGTTRAAGDTVIDPVTLFDIASLTKIFTASAALRLIARDDIALAARLDELIPSLLGKRQGRATVEQLLAHEAGFADWAPLFQKIQAEIRGTRRAAGQLFDLALEVPAHGEPGVAAVYSDLGFIVLARMLELVTGDSLEGIIAREVTGPLGLDSVSYRSTRPSSRSEQSRANDINIAATEDCPWRGGVLKGEVHDDNAWAMGGVAGHAGLFATAGDVAQLGVAWLKALDDGDWLPSELAQLAVARRPFGRGLGWDLKSEEGSSAGALMGSRTFGHLGFTGCSLWVDPDRELSVTLLTNRVHPSRHNEGIKTLRPVFHDALVGALDG
ncbi:MAG: beta-lactamase family protein [Deltaproteobacteria bacterium]|nr:beta-lactamase family protein [Deltaproteobacteria bacterium]